MGAPIHLSGVPSPFLSCTYEDFFIVLSQEGTQGFDSLLRKSNPTQPLPGPRLGVILPNQPKASHRAPQNTAWPGARRWAEKLAFCPWCLSQWPNSQLRSE